MSNISKQNEAALTTQRAHQLLRYDPDSGVFLWRVRRGGTAATGRKAGSISHNGYLRIRIDAHTYSAHRLAWFMTFGQWPESELDHIDLDKANNRLSNLRQADPSQNGRNRRVFPNNTSGYKGVSWRGDKQMYQAQIMVRRKQHHLGYFTSPELAHEAYREAAKRLHGEYARLS